MEEDTGPGLFTPKTKLPAWLTSIAGGVPLMELGDGADIFGRTVLEKFAEELQLILRYLDISGADMEKGQMRAEVNISLSQISNLKSKILGTKVEIKILIHSVRWSEL